MNDPAFQAELHEFSGALREASISYSQTALALDAVDAHGYPLAEFVILVLGPSAVHAVSSAINTWLRGRAQRTVRVKFGDVDVQAGTPEEVDRALKSVAQFQDSRSKSPKNG